MSFFTPPPPNPVPTDPLTFRTRAINMWTWLSTTLLAEFDALLTLVQGYATAMNTNDTRDTSVSSVLIGTGTKVFTVSAGKSFSAGQWLTISNTPAPTNQMIGNVTSYVGTTLTVSVPANGVFGSGTLTAWTIALTAAPSAQISAAMTPVTIAATLAAARTAIDVPNNAESEGFRPLTATIPSNTLVVTMAPCATTFRPTTLNTGLPVTVSNAANITLTAPVGASFGAIAAQAARLIVLELNNAGTKELAIINQAGGVDLSETGLINTTAISAVSTANNVAYSTTARTGVAYRVAGFIDSTQATAGTYTTALALVQPAGGKALAAISGLGYGANPSSPSRTLGTTYINTTGRPIFVTVAAVTSAATFFGIAITVGGFSYPTDVVHSNSSGFLSVRTFIVRPGKSYVVTMTNATLSNWIEES